MNLNIKKIKVSDLQPSDYNPRTISDKELDKLKRSIDEFGYVEPIIWNEKTKVIVGGHQRVKALLALGRGEEMIDVVVVNLSVKREQALNVALNRISGEWENDLLANLIEQMDELDRELTGLDNEEITALLDEQTETVDPDDDDVPEPPEKPMAQRGDVWLLGKHRVMCGDATLLPDVEVLMGGGMADMVFTDPPYNVDYKSADGKKIKNDKQTSLKFYQFLHDAFVNMNMVMKEGAPIYVAHADSEGVNFRTAFESSGLLMKQCIIWVKNVFVMGRQDYHWQHEPILYGWKKGEAHKWYGQRNKSTVVLDEREPSDMDQEELWEEVRKLRNERNTTITYEDKPARSAEHPTMKPVALVQRFIKNSSQRGDIVLDLFGGGGSTLIACENVGRVCFTMELDPRYVDVIVKRWEKKTGKKAEKE